MALFSPLAGRLSDRMEPRVVASLGMGLCAAGLLSFAWLGQASSLGFIVAALILVGFGFALFSSPNTNAIMGSVEKKNYGVAASTLGTMRIVGQMLSMGIATMVFSIFIGNVRITPANFRLFLASMKVSFVIFFVLCVVACSSPWPAAGCVNSKLMQIISKTDMVFVVFYALLIPLTGALVFNVSGQAIVLLLTPALLAVYLWLALKKPLRRRRAAGMAFPKSWSEFLFYHSAYYRGLDVDAKKKFERDIGLFFSDNNIAAIGGAEVSWQTRLLIGIGVATMLLGRPEWEPPLPDGVTVYPGMSFDRNYQIEKGNIAGQAPERGPLLIAEESLKLGFADPNDGHNVLIHELAHFFDREQRKSGGRHPRLGRRQQDVSWAGSLSREWRKHLQRGSILPSYAALNEAEFFAVACEMFFENPRPLQTAHPELYELLRDFFNQDPLLFRVLAEKGHYPFKAEADR